MKTRNALLAASLLSLSAAGYSFAGPMDSKSPAQDHSKHDMDKGMRVAPHDAMLRDLFGAELRPLEREMASNYKLKAGVGLVVKDVRADSLAAKSGLVAGDVIFQVDSQWVINTPQFCTLLAIQTVDDGFEVKVYRNGDRKDLDFKLDQTFLNSMNKAHEDAANNVKSGQATGTDRNVDFRDNQATADAAKPLIIPESYSNRDDAHDIKIETVDGSPRLTVKDAKNDQVLFQGPFGTAEERDKAPADVRSKVERLLREYVATKAP